MIGSLFSAVSTVIDKIFPDAESRERAKLKLAELAHSGQLAQLDINKQEAAHRSIWVAGWRPFIGWTCGVGVAVEFIIKPIAAAVGIDIGAVNIMELMGLLGGMLGLGSLRTYEKIKGVSK